MNFDDLKPVNSTENRIDFYWPGPSANRTEGMTISGEYLESITFRQGEPEESTVYKVRTKDGRVAGIDGMASIKRAFQTIDPGTFVGVRFNGKKKNPKTGRMYNDVEVRYMPPEMANDKAKEALGGDQVDLNTLDMPFEM